MVWQILLWLGVVVVAGVILVVALPIHVRCRWQSDPAKHAIVLLRPFGGVFPAVRVYDSVRKTHSKPKACAKHRHRDRRNRGLRLRRLPLNDVTDLLKRLIHAFEIESWHVDAEFGLGDPAETGQLYGKLTPLIYAGGSRFLVRPNFAEACLRGTALLQFRFTLFGLIWPFARFGWRMMRPDR